MIQHTPTPNSVAQLLQVTYSSPDTLEIKQAENSLEQMSSNIDFPSVLRQIVSQETSKPNRNAAAVYLRKLSHRYMANNMGEHLSKLVQICWSIITEDLPLGIKKEAVNCIENVTLKLPKPYFFQIIEAIGKELQLLQTSLDIHKVEGIAILVKKFVGVDDPTIKAVISGFVQILVVAYDALLNMLHGFVDQADNPHFVRRLQAALQIGNLLVKHVMVGNFLKYPDYLALVTKPSFATTVWKSLQLPIPTAYQDYSKQAIPGFSTYYSLKSTNIDLITKVLLKLHLVAAQSDTNILAANPLYKNVVDQVQLLKFVIPMATSARLEDLPQSVAQCLQNTLRLFTVLLSDPNFERFFSVNKTQLMYHMAIPILQLSPQQKQDYVSDPEQFVNSLIHYGVSPFSPSVPAQDDKDMVLKSYASQFIKAFCTYQHGSLIQVFTTCSDRLISGNTLDKQLSLLVLSSLLHEVITRKDIMEVLNVFVQRTIQEFSASQDDKYTRSLKLYLGYRYLVKFAVEYQDTVVLLLKLSLSILSGELPKDECLELLSIEIISDLINYGPIMQEHFQSILQVLNSLVNKDSNHKILELMADIITEFFGDQNFSNSQLVIDIVHEMVKRIHKENSCPVVNNQVSNRCWNIIRSIGNNPKFIPSLMAPIQTEISQLYPFLKDVSKIQFEEDIILMLQSFVSYSKKVTPTEFLLLEYFKPIFQKNMNRMGELYLPTNLIITYGSDLFLTHPQTVTYLLDICEIAISSQISERVSEVEHLQAIITIQSLTVSCGDYFTQEICKRIMTILFNRLTQGGELAQLSQNLISALGLIFVKSLKLVDDPMMEVIYLRVITSPPLASTSIYTRKAYLVGICEILRHLGYPMITNTYASCFAVALTVLSELLDAKQSRTKAVRTKKEDNSTQLQREYNLLLERELVNSITLSDQCLLFKETVQHVTQTNPVLLSRAIEALDKPKMQFLRSLNSLVTIGDKPRQIVRIKRN